MQFKQLPVSEVERQAPTSALSSPQPATMATKYGFTSTLKELRFLLCQTSDHSAAMRSFLTRTYPTMKKHNPHTPIMIREALGVEPKVFARYEFGKEKMISLKGLDDKTIETKVTELVKSGI